jgi:pteridine reductase
VLALARDGADVAIHYRSSAAAAEATAAEVRRLGRRAALLAADLADAAAAEALPARAAAELGRLDVLVNSASLFESAPLLAVSAEDWDRVMAVNLRAPFLLTRAAAPFLDDAGGVIINISDLAGLQAWSAFPHHGVSKAGVIHLTRVSARSLGPGIRVNCVVPGTVLPPDDYTDEQVAASVERTVLKRVGSPRDVVEAMLFLIRSDFATGSIVVVDGGRMLR